MRPTLLIAESDAELRDAYRRLLAGHGFDVETAADGLDCLEKLRRLAPEVCVLDRDLCWGGADGVLAWLREESAAPRVAVMLTATAGTSPHAAKDAKPPVVGFLPTPFVLTALLESVRRIVASGGQGEPFHGSGVPASPEQFLG
jgi:DNA-binding NtrC family response regulator